MGEDQDIPLFSYGLEEALDINLEEIQKEIQMKQWQAEAKNEENFQRLQMMMNGGDPYMVYGQDFTGEMPEMGQFPFQEGLEGEFPEQRLETEQIPVEAFEVDEQSEQNFAGTIQNQVQEGVQNVDIQIDHRSNSQVCNLPIVHMGEMLQNQNPTPMQSRGAIGSYYSNLSVLGNSKPFFFPPPDLGMVESMGSYENSSRFFRSVKSSNMNKSFNKNMSI